MVTKRASQNNKPVPPASASPKQKKHPGGRPTKFNPKLLATITTALRKCAPMETAAALAGISKDTLYAWLKRGARAQDAAKGDPTRIKASERPYAEFSDALKQAMAEGEVSALGTIWAAGQTRTGSEGEDIAGQWQALAWILERTRHEKYGRRERLSHEGVPGGEALRVEYVDTSKLPLARPVPDEEQGPE